MSQESRQSRVSPTPVRARVLVTGDQSLVRGAIGRLIASEPAVEVVGECSNRCDALAAAMTARPDMVVMDLDLDSRVETVAEILAAVRPCPVLILTGNDDPRGVATAFNHGALGVVMKNNSAEVLMSAVRAIVAGEMWLESAAAATAFDGTSQDHDSVGREKLTRREIEIVKLVSLGLRNQKIAERLFIAETTVRHHLTSIFIKLAVRNRLELMRYAYGDRVVSADARRP